MKNLRILPIALALLAAAGALAIAGCGGDDEDGEQEAIAFSEWKTQADEICAEAESTLQTRSAEFIEEAGENPSEEALEDLATDVLVPTFGELADDLDGLPPPDENTDQAEEMISSLQEGVDALEDDPSLVTSGEGPEGIQRATEIATELGLESCGEAT